jgi:glutamate N-acetyltransferase/amino-acid N-acetyltransferase
MVSVDGDTSPSDTVLLMANGLAKNKLIVSGSQQADIFQQALNQICVYLAKAIARDGEGATRLIEVTVTGALNIADARLAARTIVSSSLVKTAVHGADPNWGRIIVAAGRSGAEVVPSKLNLSIGDVLVLKGGTPLSYDEASVIEVFKRKEVPITLNLNLGTASATAWGCDLSKKYVTINSQYMT